MIIERNIGNSFLGIRKSIPALGRKNLKKERALLKLSGFLELEFSGAFFPALLRGPPEGAFVLSPNLLFLRTFRIKKYIYQRMFSLF